ncbi:MAG: hypothetical protein M3132_13605 [Actinomycetia bacterium]|nr:hypothetical protein [Actinomycetes bacterium]
MVISTDREFWRSRVEDTMRHLADLEHDYYEEAKRREAREAVFLEAFSLLTPLATEVLEDMNEWLLGGAGTVATHLPIRDDSGGINGKWTLTWDRLEQGINVHTREPLQPVTIDAVYPLEWTHGHLARLHAGLPGEVTAWPMQVRTALDAARQEPILRAIVESEIHERVYQTDGDWRLVKEA